MELNCYIPALILRKNVLTCFCLFFFLVWLHTVPVTGSAENSTVARWHINLQLHVHKFIILWQLPCKANNRSSKLVGTEDTLTIHLIYYKTVIKYNKVSQIEPQNNWMMPYFTDWVFVSCSLHTLIWWWADNSKFLHLVHVQSNSIVYMHVWHEWRISDNVGILSR